MQLVYIHYYFFYSRLCVRVVVLILVALIRKEEEKQQNKIRIDVEAASVTLNAIEWQMVKVFRSY